MEGDGKDCMERFDDSRIFPALFLPYRSYQASLMKACASSGICPTYVICFFIYIHLLSLYIYLIPVFVHMARLWGLQMPHSM